MNTYVRVLLSYVLASLFCLGVWYNKPVPIPRVDVHALTPLDINATLEHERRQQVIERAINISAHLYRNYRCPTHLARPTVQYAMLSGVPVRIATAVVIVESSCRQRAESRAGAIGYMQVMPKIHHVSRKQLFDRDTNLQVGNRYLAQLIREHGIEDGIAHYFGVTEGSEKGYDYAYHVLEVAGYRK